MKTHAVSSAVIGAVVGTAAMLAGGPLIGGTLAMAAYAMVQGDEAALRPLEVNDADSTVIRGLKHTVNAGATAMAYGLAFVTGACGITAGAAAYGFLIGFGIGMEIPKNQSKPEGS